MKKTFFLSFLFLCLSLCSLALGEGLRIHFLNVQHGDCAIVECDGETLVIDGGKAEDSALIHAYLTKTLGVDRVEHIIATHPHKDHIGGLPAVLAACPVDNVYSPIAEYDSKPFERLRKNLDTRDIALKVPEQGYRFSLGEAVVELFMPVRVHENTNNMSIITRIRYRDTAFLFMGDAKLAAEEDLLASGRELRADLIKIGHHGREGSTSDALLDAVRPQLAVISEEALGAGGKDQKVLEKLRDRGISCYVTAEHGHIIVDSNGSQLRVETEHGAANAK